MWTDRAGNEPDAPLPAKAGHQERPCRNLSRTVWNNVPVDCGPSTGRERPSGFHPVSHNGFSKCVHRPAPAEPPHSPHQFSPTPLNEAAAITTATQPRHSPQGNRTSSSRIRRARHTGQIRQNAERNVLKSRKIVSSNTPLASANEPPPTEDGQMLQEKRSTHPRPSTRFLPFTPSGLATSAAHGRRTTALPGPRSPLAAPFAVF